MEHLMAEPMGPVELSRRLDLTSAAATVLLHRLEGSGHIERRPHPTDRRRQVVVPRPEGMVAVFRELRPMIEGLDRVAAGFDPAERAVIARYLAGVVEVLRHTVEHGPQD
jgi:DNA-binding MarR family transcriptional regulator